jgi:hypothetical protein
VVAVVAAVAVAAVIMHAAWTDNLRCQIHECEGPEIYWERWLMLGAVWAALSFALTWPFVFVIDVLTLRSIRRRNG